LILKFFLSVNLLLKSTLPVTFSFLLHLITKIVKMNIMKTLQYLTAILVFTLSSQILVAESDQPTLKESAPKAMLEVKDLVPEIPKTAEFDEEVTFTPDLSPEIPKEAPFSETL